MRDKTLTILAIDDNPGCLRAASRVFTLVWGHKVEVAENGSEGLKKAENVRPNIILLDMMMPDMTGLQVMDRLCESSNTCDIPVILLTGSRLEDAEYDALKAKRNFMLMEEKPADFEKLLNTIETALRH